MAAEAPKQIDVSGLSDYLEVMAQAIFQTGISWKVVESKWPGIRDALHGFDVETVAHLSPTEVDRLMEDERVIRHRGKLDAIVHNADRILELDREHGGFRNYLRDGDDYWAIAKKVKKEFKYLGDMGVFWFMYVVKEDVPEYEEWQAKTGK